MNHLPHVLDLLADIPKPGAGSTPPGFGKFNDVMGWAKWIALGILVMAIMAAGVRMAVASRHGDGGEHVAVLGRALMGVIIVSASVALVTELVGA